MTSPEELAAAERGSVVAAAGCGKTELLARSVAAATGRQLVLTHTNAGVEALRRRLRHWGVSNDRSAVDTIAGWCLKYILAFPGRSGGMPVNPNGSTNWPAIYPAMTALVRAGIVRKVLDASYSGAFVDEYQDCDEAQHSLISALTEILPVRILGDPLQAVFRFAGDPPPWFDSVEVKFPRIGTLGTPWRWQREGHNEALGEWLMEARDALEDARPLDLGDERLAFIQTPSFGDWQELAREACFNVADRGGTSAAILKWPADYQRLGRVTGGLYQCVEPIDARDAGRWLRELEQSEPENRADRLVDFMRTVAIHVDGAIGPVNEALAESDRSELIPAVRTAADLIERVSRPESSPSDAAEALDALGHLPDMRVFRRELLWAAIDSLRDANERGYVELEEALRYRRNLTSHTGRRLARRTAGSTLLLKGMEFDHAIVVNTGCFTVNDLYVALTRGSRSLTVLSPESVVDPQSLQDR